MNVANRLTVGRFVLTLVFFLALTFGGRLWFDIGLVALLLAAVTDILDGVAARRMNQTTLFGQDSDLRGVCIFRSGLQRRGRWHVGDIAVGASSADRERIDCEWVAELCGGQRDADRVDCFREEQVRGSVHIRLDCGAGSGALCGE